MYNILLVDDEIVDLEGLNRFVPWEELQLNIVASVDNGFEALDVIRSSNVDIVLTDISMPIMSGLELAEQMLDLKPHIKIIFISGYQDFHYAKQAIQLNASGYVLKPVDDNELLRTIRQTVSSLDQERREEQQNHGIRTYLPHMKQELMRQWLEGEIGSRDLPPFMEEYNKIMVGESLCVALIELDDIRWKLRRYTEDEQAKITQETLEEVIEFCNRSQYSLYCRTDAYRIALILTREFDVEKVRHLHEKVGQKHALTLTIGLGQVCGSREQLPASYRKAREVLNHKMFFGKNRIIEYDEIRSEITEETRDMDEIMHTLFSHMSKYELLKIDDCIQDLFLIVKNLVNKFTVYNFSLHIITKLDAYLQTLNENLYAMMQWNLEDINILFELETIEDIKSWLRRMIFQLSELLHLKQANSSSKLVIEVTQYIDTHIEQGVTFKEISRIFAFSPNYLRQLFKKATGESIHDYMIRKKIERACSYLKDPKIKIFEIADRLGYVNITHFNKQFRVAMGMSPRDYRKQC